MVHWIFIAVGFAFGFFFGACSIFYILGNKMKSLRQGGDASKS